MSSKRYVFFSIAVLAALTLLPFSGAMSAATPAQRVEFRIAGGPVGGSKDIRLEGISEAIRLGNPTWDVSVTHGPMTSAELAMIARKETDLKTSPLISVIDLRRGMFQGVPRPEGPMNLSWVAPSNTYRAGFFAFENVPINSLIELKEKKYPIKVSVHRPGADPFWQVKLILEAHGITHDDMKKWGAKLYNMTNPAAGTALADGVIQAHFMSGMHPEPNFVELSHNRKLKLLAFDPEAVEKLKKLGFIPGVIFAGSYKFTPKDVPTVTTPNSIAVRADMDDNIAYNVARAIWEQKNFLFTVHTEFKSNLTAENIQELAKHFGDLLHPGARRYYQEQGILK